MGSVENQNPWPPYAYDTYRDCSQGICSIYCPQWCYIIFAPPPPFTIGDDDSGTDFSPLIIAVIGILASAFILVSYYTIISKYCRRRSNQSDHNSMELDGNHDQMNNEAWQTIHGGLDESVIKSITVCKYKKSDGFVDGTDCSVCLSEFQENEDLRLLPKCSHAFHLPCIDTWLKSHSSCPLCRANIALPNNVSPSPVIQEPPPPTASSTTTSTVTATEYQPSLNDAVLVIQDLQAGGGFCEESLVNNGGGGGEGDIPKPANQEFELNRELQNTENENIVEIRDDPIIQPIRRSVSFNSYCRHDNQVSIADILRIEEEEEEESETEMNRVGMLNLIRSPLAMKRSSSTGRFNFTRYENGRSSMSDS